jgi:hypothetical protein
MFNLKIRFLFTAYVNFLSLIASSLESGIAVFYSSTRWSNIPFMLQNTDTPMYINKTYATGS